MKTVRVAVIGVGSMGSAHAACIARGEVPGLSLAAICDIQPQRCARLQESFPGVRSYSRWENAVASQDIDAVIVATPHPTHGRITIAAMENGKHVLTEKPVDVRVSVARQVNRVAEQTGVVFAAMLNQRTNALFRKARELVHSGQLGELKRSVWIVTNWYRSQHYYDSGGWRATWSGEGGGVLLNQCPHQLDLWQWICGMPCQVTAYCDIAKFHDIEVEDDVTITVRYPNGATGAFIASTGEYPGTNRLEISGTLGKLVIEQGVLKWWRLKESERAVCRESSKSSPEISYEYLELSQSDPDPAHRGILQNFAEAILEGKPLLSPGTEAIQELLISNAAYFSAWSGSIPVPVPCPEALFDEKFQALQQLSGQKQLGESASHQLQYDPRWAIRW